MSDLEGVSAKLFELAPNYRLLIFDLFLSALSVARELIKRRLRLRDTVLNGKQVVFSPFEGTDRVTKLAAHLSQSLNLLSESLQTLRARIEASQRLLVRPLVIIVMVALAH
jgi:hypothetical protein